MDIVLENVLTVCGWLAACVLVPLGVEAIGWAVDRRRGVGIRRNH